MGKALILEERVSDRAADYDHVFSFSSNPADSFPEDYITQSEINEIYDQTYEEVCSRLASAFNHLQYRKVSLLTCFRKPIFLHTFYARAFAVIFQRVRLKNQSCDFYLKNSTHEKNWSYLSQILEQQDSLGPIHIIYDNSGNHSIKHDPGHRLKLFGPSKVSFGNLRSCRVAFFSDYEKSKAVLQRLHGNDCILFSTTVSARTLMRAFKHHTALFQVQTNSMEHSRRNAVCESYISEWLASNPFSNLMLNDFSGIKFIVQKVAELLREGLPKLLCEIDAMFNFFIKAHSLESALLDEDVSPAKNAFCQIARMFGIQTYVECHGALGGRHGLVPITADHIFVWGNAQKRRLLQWGCKNEEVIVSGRSQYESYKILDKDKVKRKIFKRFNLHPDKRTGLLAMPTLGASWFFFFENKMKRITLEALDLVYDLVKLQDMQFIIKLHPVDPSINFYSDWVNRHSLTKKVVVIKSYDPLLLAKASDFMIAYGSTTYAIDGFALGLPVICLDSDMESYYEELKPYSIFRFVNNRRELEKAIADLNVGKLGPDPETLNLARRECLNENGLPPDEIIASYLKNGSLPGAAQKYAG